MCAYHFIRRCAYELVLCYVMHDEHEGRCVLAFAEHAIFSFYVLFANAKFDSMCYTFFIVRHKWRIRSLVDSILSLCLQLHFFAYHLCGIALIPFTSVECHRLYHFVYTTDLHQLPSVGICESACVLVPFEFSLPIFALYNCPLLNISFHTFDEYIAFYW